MLHPQKLSTCNSTQRLPWYHVEVPKSPERWSLTRKTEDKRFFQPFHCIIQLQALAVFLLYVRCTAINPADPGVLGNPHHYKHDRKESSELSAGITPEPAGVPLSIHNSSPSSVTSSVKEFNMKASSLEEGHQGRHKTSNMCSCGLCGLCCGWMVIPDDSCRSKPPVDEENVLFCTLCNAEVTTAWT